MSDGTADLAQIPDKVYFRIGEVSGIVGVDAHVLRYWESEFTAIKPVRGKSRQRLYRRRDVELLLHIKDLLHRQGYTIAGAQKMVQQRSLQACTPKQTRIPGLHPVEVEPILDQVKQELNALLLLLAWIRTPKNKRG